MQALPLDQFPFADDTAMYIRGEAEWAPFGSVVPAEVSEDARRAMGWREGPAVGRSGTRPRSEMHTWLGCHTCSYVGGGLTWRPRLLWNRAIRMWFA